MPGPIGWLARWSGTGEWGVVQHVITGSIKMPALGFGTVRLHGEQCRAAIVDALAIGYRSIDTARRYGNEIEVGDGIARSSVPREKIFLTTKLDFTNYTRDGVAHGIRESLKRLSTDYVDLLLMHWPSDEVPMEETLGAMQEQHRAGLVRSIGVSNFTPTLLREAAQTARIAVNQVEYHPYLSQRLLLATHAELDLILTAYCPIARGDILHDPVLAEIGRDKGKTVTQVALRWLMQQERVTTIVRSSDPGRRRVNAQIFDFSLSDGEMARIHGLARGRRIIDPPFAPDWEA